MKILPLMILTSVIILLLVFVLNAASFNGIKNDIEKNDQNKKHEKQ